MTNETPLIFLDIDGVLNSSKFLTDTDNLEFGTTDYVDPKAVRRLKSILDAVPEARIVISSNWRFYLDHTKINDILVTQGLPPNKVVGETNKELSRVPAIVDYLRDWGRFTHVGGPWVAIDDDLAILGLGENNTVLTYFEEGLTDKQCLQATRILTTSKDTQ